MGRPPKYGPRRQRRWLKHMTPDERAEALRNSHNRANREYKERNRETLRTKGRTQYARDPHRARIVRILWRFKLTPVQWLAAIHHQQNRCACCRTTDPGSVHGWHIDHDHVTGRFRGMLCHRCNTVLGMLGDQLPDVRYNSETYIRYLENS